MVLCGVLGRVKRAFRLVRRPRGRLVCVSHSPRVPWIDTVKCVHDMNMGVRVTKDFKQRFDAFRNGVSADKIMSKALRKLAAQGEMNGN